MLIGAKKNAIAALLISGCAIVSGCGGGGGGGSASGSAPVASVGTLIDSVVAGIAYRTATQSGATDGLGNFNYLLGEIATFSVGGVDLFSAPAAGVVTPLNAIGLNSTGQTNLLRLLQTLDRDGNPANGIQLEPSLTGIPATLNLGSPTFESDMSAFLTAAQSAGLIPVAALVSAIDAQAHFDNRNSIVGSWYREIRLLDPQGLLSAPLPLVLTFLSDGTYLLADNGNLVSLDPDGTPGIEVGTYTYFPLTGAFFSTCPTINTDGGWGLSHPIDNAGCTGTTATMKISGNTMTFQPSGGAPLAFARVLDAGNEIVGSWYHDFANGGKPGLPVVLTFLGDGTYFMADNGNTHAADPNGQPGLEVGTYRYDLPSNLLTGSITSNCANINTDGGWGLSDPFSPVGCTGSYFGTIIRGNIMTLLTIGPAGSALSFKRVTNLGTWTPAGNLVSPFKSGTATLLPGGKVLVGGGGILEQYDSDTGAWATVAAVAPIEHSATLLPTGKVLIAGGTIGSNATGNASLYDPVSGTQVNTGFLGTARHSHRATFLSTGMVLVTGGSDSSGSPLASAELYDPTTGAWVGTGSLATARSGHTATLLPNGKVLVVGGRNSAGGFLASAELYDPLTGTWATTGSLAGARSGHTATLLPNGTVLVPGGVDGSGNALASSELYDPLVGIWIVTGNLVTARLSHTVTSLPDGKVLLAGGSTGANTLASAELYDPVAGTWANTASLATARNSHTAVLLPTGEVLVTGGLDSSGNVLRSAENYL